MKSAEMNVILFDGNDVIATSGDSNLCTMTSESLYEVTSAGARVYYFKYTYDSISQIWTKNGEGKEHVKKPEWEDAVAGSFYHSTGNGAVPCTKYHNGVIQ